MTDIERFEEIFTKNIKRDGADKLLDFLRKSDFYTAPASAKFHGAEQGGLLSHCLKVYERLLKMLNDDMGEKRVEKYSDDTVALCALMHDLCKVNYYKLDFRNQKVNGEWIKVPCYTVDDQFPFGHGEKSVYMLLNFVKLNKEESMAINWHMGGFDDRAKTNGYALSLAMNRFPLCVYLHVADLLASYMDEKRADSVAKY